MLESNQHEPFHTAL